MCSLNWSYNLERRENVENGLRTRYNAFAWLCCLTDWPTKPPSHHHWQPACGRHRRRNPTTMMRRSIVSHALIDSHMPLKRARDELLLA
jgi:hypothetical protein